MPNFLFSSHIQFEYSQGTIPLIFVVTIIILKSILQNQLQFHNFTQQHHNKIMSYTFFEDLLYITLWVTCWGYTDKSDVIFTLEKIIQVGVIERFVKKDLFKFLSVSFYSVFLFFFPFSSFSFSSSSPVSSFIYLSEFPKY